MRRALATVFTIGTLSTFALAAVLGLMLAVGQVSLGLAVAVVVLLNLLMLLVGPTVNDLIYRLLYDMEWVEPSDLRERSPAAAAVLEDVTEEYGYRTPKLGLIDDMNPTAFTYGSARFNARVVLTEGCFEYLDDDEVASVMAHELGHVTARDFITMTVANTLIQVLYLVAVYAWRAAATGTGGGGGRGRGGARGLLFGVALLSYLLWFLGEYVVLWLSRVREYAADGFAAEWTDPDDMSQALVKIAYGIVTSEDSPELAKATRNIGIMDVADSKDEGLIYHTVRDEGAPEDLLTRSFLFDLKNPWARLLELKSTHPLTGKRIRVLSREPGADRFDFAAVLRREEVDRGRLWRQFLRDVGVLALPVGLAVFFPLLYLGASLALGAVPFSPFTLLGGWLVAIAVGMVAQTVYKYPRGEAADTTVLQELANVYASPVRGTRVRLEGDLIGRGQAGYRFSEDLMFEDRTGLLYLVYDHWLPVVGDLLFSVRRVPDLVGSPARVEGWYFRGTGQYLGIRRLEAGDETVRGFVHLGGYVAGAVLGALGLAILGVGLAV